MADSTRVQEFKDAVDAGDQQRVIRLSETNEGEPAEEQVDVVADDDGFYAAMGGKVIVVE